MRISVRTIVLKKYVKYNKNNMEVKHREGSPLHNSFENNFHDKSKPILEHKICKKWIWS